MTDWANEFKGLNVRKQPPNKLITFVEALDGPNKAIAQDFLERIAAIVYPVWFPQLLEEPPHCPNLIIQIMKDNGLAVLS